MSQQVHGVVAVDIAARAYFASLPIAREAGSAMPFEERASDRTPTDTYVVDAVALPGVALSAKDMLRIQNLGTGR